MPTFHRAWAYFELAFFRWFCYIAVNIFLYEQSKSSTLLAECLLFTYMSLVLSIYLSAFKSKLYMIVQYE
jgi:hypothetical protein